MNNHRLVRWNDDTIVPSNAAAVSRVEEQVFRYFDHHDSLVLRIRFEDQYVSARDLSAYLGLLDGVFGRTDRRGFRSYSLRVGDHLRLRRIGSGSTILEIALTALGDVEPWRLLLAYLVMRTGPSILKGEAARNWAEATRALGEAALVWSDVAARVSLSRTEATLTRRQRSSIRKIIQGDPLFAQLSRRDVDVLVRMVEEVLLQESGRLPAAARFDVEHVLDVALGLESEMPRAGLD